VSGVVVAGLDKTYPGRPPVRALDRVDLVVPAGRVTAVLGPSGCGKTTLLRTIAGFERPDAGTVTIGGREVSSATAVVPPERRRIGIVPQDGALFPHLDVAGNVGFALRGTDRATRRARVDELLELVGLADHGSRRPDQLSGGQQQRVAIARALASQPEVVLLDEPFTALDVALRTRLRRDVAEVLRRSGATAVLVTHDPVEALALADEVAVMAAGRITQQGPGAEVYRRPVDLATARTLGDVVTVAATVTAAGTGVVAAGVLGAVAVEPADHDLDGPVTLLLRPEQLQRRAGGLEATVAAIEFRGHDADVALVIDGTTLTARWPGVDVVPVGSTVTVAVVGTGCVLPSER
jgi:iron(III) transport system ATP-binding protein